MQRIAVIGGTGLCDWQGATVLQDHCVRSDYGEPSSPIQSLSYEGVEFLFLARHGVSHDVPPHRVNYRANIRCLKDLGVSHILAVNAVGGIGADYGTGVLALPDQIIDYTWGREHTFFDGHGTSVEHIDFTQPFSQGLRELLVAAAKELNLPLMESGVYGVTQGPRLETAAEVRRLSRDGCDVIGMTAMPEAGLARELGLDYASLCLVVNPAAGESDKIITMADIHLAIDEGIHKIKAILSHSLLQL